MKNKVINEKDYSVIIINSKKFGEVRVLIDTEDVEKISSYRWHATYYPNIKGFYIRTTLVQNKKHKFLVLHRYLMNTPQELQVDHINHNTLDNRKSNLRNCTAFGNMQNLSTNKSGKAGVRWCKRDCIWYASITINNKRIYLGIFNEFKDAKLAREKAEIEYSKRVA